MFKYFKILGIIGVGGCMISKKRIVFLALLFFGCLFFTLICNPLNLDEVWNYGFSYNIYSGLIPYQDFNMVIPPFYPFFMSLFFHLFSSGILAMHIVNAIIVCVSLYLLFLLLDKRAYLVLLFFFFPVVVVFPNYNFFLVFLVILLIHLEKLAQKNNQYHLLIGFILGLAILTKHTVGICLVLPSLYYWADKKLLYKRLVGIFLPLLVFLLYLFFSETFMSFFDLCVLGLLDFTGNWKGLNIYFLFYVVLLIGNIYLIKKDTKNIVCYYILAFGSILIPIFDIYHFVCYWLIYLIMILPKIKKDYVQYFLLTSVTLVILACLLFFSYCGDGKIIYPNDLSKFEYRFINEKNLKFTKEVLHYIQNNPSKEIIFLDPNAYYFRLILGQECGYLDLINTGNWGYHGSQKLLKDVSEKKKNVLFFIDYNSFVGYDQADKRALEYVMTQYKEIEVIGIYHVYSTES